MGKEPPSAPPGGRPARENREPGENPGRYRHCKRGGPASVGESQSLGDREGGARPRQGRSCRTRKPGDLLGDEPLSSPDVGAGASDAGIRPRQHCAAGLFLFLSAKGVTGYGETCASVPAGRGQQRLRQDHRHLRRAPGPGGPGAPGGGLQVRAGLHRSHVPQPDHRRQERQPGPLFLRLGHCPVPAGTEQRRPGRDGHRGGHGLLRRRRPRRGPCQHL